LQWQKEDRHALQWLKGDTGNTMAKRRQRGIAKANGRRTGNTLYCLSVFF
jgi:hypothetical protein